MGFLAIFDIIPSWCYALAIAVLTLVLGAEKLSHDHTKIEAANFKVQVEQRETARASAVAVAEHLRAENATLRAMRAQEINDALQDERKRTAVAVAAGADTRRLLIDATARAAGRREGDTDSQALSRATETAAAYGKLLERCDAVAENLGRNAEDLASQVRGLIKVYESLLLSGSPVANGGQVDPGTATGRDVVVDTTLPVLAVDPAVNGKLSLIRIRPQVHLERYPTLHHLVDHPVIELGG